MGSYFISEYLENLKRKVHDDLKKEILIMKQSKRKTIYVLQSILVQIQMKLILLHLRQQNFQVQAR
jgi:hypothetical protein